MNFAAPLFREHHRDLHRYGNEVAWWANIQIAIEAAKQLWQATLVASDGPISRKGPCQPHDNAMRGGGSIDPCFLEESC